MYRGTGQEGRTKGKVLETNGRTLPSRYRVLSSWTRDARCETAKGRKPPRRAGGGGAAHGRGPEGERDEAAVRGERAAQTCRACPPPLDAGAPWWQGSVGHSRRGDASLSWRGISRLFVLKRHRMSLRLDEAHRGGACAVRVGRTLCVRAAGYPSTVPRPPTSRNDQSRRRCSHEPKHYIPGPRSYLEVAPEALWLLGKHGPPEHAVARGERFECRPQRCSIAVPGQTYETAGNGVQEAREGLGLGPTR